VFIIASLASPSAMVVIAIAVYGLAQGGDVFPWVDTWKSGGPLPMLAVQLLTSLLVGAALLSAIACMLATGKSAKNASDNRTSEF
jgi:hypothetical protein